MAAPLALLVLLAGCDSEPGPEVTPTGQEPTGESPVGETSAPDGGGEPSAEDVATGLVTPWDVEPLDDGRLLVSSRDTGEILVIGPDDGTEVAGAIAQTVPRGEGGLLGLALSQDEATLFAYVSTAEDNRVLSMSWDGTSLGEPSVVLDGIANESTHNGGGLVLGPDGYLYVSTGDAQQPSRSQDLDSLNGKVLRMTTAGEPAPGNPFGTLVYSYGHRNVQGLAFDDEGRLWASEFGQNTWDELNLIEPGANYGWPEVEGFGVDDADPDLTDPMVTWPTNEASPSGLAFWEGSLWMATLQGQALIEIPLDGATPGDPTPHLAGEYGRLRAVTPDGDGLLVTTSNTDGRGNPAADDDRVLRITG